MLRKETPLNSHPVMYIHEMSACAILPTEAPPQRTSLLGPTHSFLHLYKTLLRTHTLPVNALELRPMFRTVLELIPELRYRACISK
jgi:hypothetical protein